jgi:cytochrome d ubiquinol oxidase subunit I
VGRQPYLIYGVMTTASAVSSVPGESVALTLAGYAIVYTGLLISYMVVLTQMVRKEAKPGEPKMAPEPAAGVPFRA